MSKDDAMKTVYKRSKPPSALDKWAETIKNDPSALEEYRRLVKESKEGQKEEK